MKWTLIVAAFAAAPAHAQESPAARSLAATCANCHGTGGRSVSTEVASLAGLPKDDIAAKLKGFRDGTRPATVMQQLVRGYTDQQIGLIAEYFSGRPR